MIEAGELDFTKPHVIMGAGPGRDLVIQNGCYYTSWGQQVSPDQASFQKAGIPWTHEIELEIRKRNLQAKHDAERRKLEEMIRKIDEEESARIKAGLGVSSYNPEEEDTLSEPLDLSGLEDLEQEEVAPKPSKVKVTSKK